MDQQTLQQLLENNRRWAVERRQEEPLYFEKLCSQQAPRYLWIGCSDSRVPANQITGLAPGEVFVHRNVANIVVHTDFNCLSVIQYAVEVLKVEHIIVCGHYGCGGVSAALQNRQRGLIDNWLRNIKDLYDRHEHEFKNMTTDLERMDKLCELNVENQVVNVCHTTIVQNAWQNGQKLGVHGWCYRLSDGIIRDLGVTIDTPDRIKDIFKML
jgi:carbonic anhydrase